MLQNEWRNRAIFITIIVMLICLFSSRALLSISQALFVSLALLQPAIAQTLKKFLRSPVLISMSILFVVPLLSGLWTQNMQEWPRVMLAKAPLLFFPLAFAANWTLSKKEWTMILASLLLLVAAGICWSVGQYLSNPTEMHESYLRAKTIPTPLGNDHVRFSLLVSLCILFCVEWIRQSTKRLHQLILASLLVVFIAYIHILSARMGLVTLYVLATGYFFYGIQRYGGRAITMLFLFTLLVLASWCLLPTLQNRMRYVKYDLSFIRSDSIQPGTSDANRMLSLRAGWHTLQHYPWGVGAGAVWNASRTWYTTNLPGMNERDQLYPSSEWMVYGNFAGWPGMTLFTLAIILPFFYQSPHRFSWILLQGLLAGSFILETTLEIQFGIFIYCFISLAYWRWLEMQKK